ncbi:43871_t:CDS:2 [Gigaspora margarita]|uniref:43871_t:CDS:1 n=1 Tax=Gigaspora margarita TaxID=4874 RepID=A0ABN7UPR6_GIGMA|nr:43871_t:CDS:2 [Gigaspora margarita]
MLSNSNIPFPTPEPPKEEIPLEEDFNNLHPDNIDTTQERSYTIPSFSPNSTSSTNLSTF